MNTFRKRRNWDQSLMRSMKDWGARRKNIFPFLRRKIRFRTFLRNLRSSTTKKLPKVRLLKRNSNCLKASQRKPRIWWIRWKIVCSLSSNKSKIRSLRRSSPSSGVSTRRKKKKWCSNKRSHCPKFKLSLIKPRRSSRKQDNLNKLLRCWRVSKRDCYSRLNKSNRRMLNLRRSLLGKFRTSKVFKNRLRKLCSS